jgi:hypothetical protein
MLSRLCGGVKKKRGGLFGVGAFSAVLLALLWDGVLGVCGAEVSKESYVIFSNGKKFEPSIICVFGFVPHLYQTTVAVPIAPAPPSVHLAFRGPKANSLMALSYLGTENRTSFATNLPFLYEISHDFNLPFQHTIRYEQYCGFVTSHF